MNKKNNRKGFTTVELVIVIAVIAILAAVLIPTFSNLISKANESAAIQAATAARTAIMNDALMPDSELDIATGETVYIKVMQNNTPYWYSMTITSNELVEVTTAPDETTLNAEIVEDLSDDNVTVYTVKDTPNVGGEDDDNQTP